MHAAQPWPGALFLMESILPAPAVLIVDDNPRIFRSLNINLQDSGYEVFWAKNGAEALENAKAHTPSVILLDLSLGEENGLRVLEKLRAAHPGIPVIMITGYGTFEAAVQSIKIGAYDFLPKPLDFDRLLSIIEKAIEIYDSAGLSRDEDDAMLGQKIVTRSPLMLNAIRKACMLGKTDLPILITGESGCGKELFVELIHEKSARKDAVLRRINCSAYPDTLIDNELFGHEKGAYTGANSVHKGLFEQAHRGSLHLDEIADLALPSQAKLLRVLEEGTLFRLGGDASVKIDVRVIASTNKNITREVESGKFREDLFYRLNAVFIYLPPLRERKVDIGPLVTHFLADASAGGPRKFFSPEAMELLHRYDWPGNVRELKNMVRMCHAITEGDCIGADSLPQSVVESGEDDQTRDSIEEAEKDLIKRVLEESRFNKQKASQRLGISRKTLYNKLKGYGID